jgi:hypothetical protein
MSNLLLKERPHIRFNRLTGEWVSEKEGKGCSKNSLTCKLPLPAGPRLASPNAEAMAGESGRDWGWG